MDEIERRIHERYNALENQESSLFIIPGIDTKKITKQPLKEATMSNKISDLRDTLFETIKDLRSGKIEIEQAKTIADIAQVVVNSAKAEVDFIRAVGGRDSYFFPASDVKTLK
jgi:replication initiation and membrane attachment protein DnaB